MYRHNQTALSILVVVLAIAAATGEAADRKYAVNEEFTLRRSVNGVEGTLELLLDSRLTVSIRRQLWGQGEWSFVFQKNSVLYREFSARPPRKSKLIILDKEGKSIATRILETPLARVEKWNVSSDADEFFLLTEDDSAGVGSYNGLVTTLIQISDSTFKDIKAINEQTGREESIRMMKSLKNDWRRVGDGEILSVSCHPRIAAGKVQDDFVTDYVRYQFDRTRWFEYKREAAGIWESDQGFPTRSAFP